MLPFLRNDAPWFTFIGHPRHEVDLEKIGGTALLRRYSVNERDFLRKIGSIPPLVIGQISFPPQAVTGEVIAVMCMPHLMVLPTARQEVLAGILLAASRGSRVIGLGALTAPATGAGLSIISDVPRGITVTTGNAYTAAVVHRNVSEACARMNMTNPHIAVLGCTGSVGFSASHLLADAGYRLTLIGRSQERAQTLFRGTIKSPNVSFAGTLDALRDVDVVIALTNDNSAKLAPHHLRSESVVIDVAQPANIERNHYEAFRKKGIYVAEGGIVRIQDYMCTFDFGLSDSTTFACLAETYLFARDGLTNHSLGRALPDLSRYLEKLAARYHVTPSPLDLRESCRTSVCAAV
jgi:fatty aldehyde-generating acyl-ACP reductase